MSQQIPSIIGRYSSELVSRLRFLPLGLLWGITAGSLTTYRYISSRNGLLGNGLLRFDVDVSSDWSRIELIFVPIIGAVAGSLLIATLLGSALLNRKSSSIRWLVDWVMTGAASCAGGAAVFVLILTVRRILGLLEWMQTMKSYESPAFLFGAVIGAFIAGGVVALVYAVLIAIESAVVALVLAPLSLLVRRLILRRTRVAETVGGASRSQT